MEFAGSAYFSVNLSIPRNHYSGGRLADYAVDS